MTTFESLLLVIALVGVGIPAWICAAITTSSRHQAVSVKNGGFPAYTALIDRILDEFDKDKGRGPIMVAAVRELRSFPEYRDTTVLLLNEVTVTGSSQYDRLMEVEIRETEAFLLEVKV